MIQGLFSDPYRTSSFGLKDSDQIFLCKISKLFPLSSSNQTMTV